MTQTYTLGPMKTGLNNQRLAILGLALIARERGGRVKIPVHLHDFTPTAGGLGSNVLPIEAVFDLGRLRDLLREEDLLSETVDAQFIPFSDCFSKGADAIRSELGKTNIRNSWCAEVISSISACEQLREVATDVVSRLPSDTVAVQLRIERDWKIYLASKNLFAGPHGSEEIVLDALRVFTKMRNQPAIACFRNIYICCDADDLLVTKSSVRADAARCGFNCFFNSDLESGLKSRLQRSVVDFSVCLLLPAYVGLTRSTFSNMQCLCACYMSEMPPEHFIFNCLGDQVLRRTDMGRASTPNGALNAYDAVRTNGS